MTTADPAAVLEACLHRIAAHNPSINAFLTVDTQAARQAAQAASQRWRHGHPLSPIDGMTIGIKANIAVAGMPWHAGIGAYRNRIATRDAACVARLREAGAVLLGTLNMDTAALGASTDNTVFGRTENPHHPGYSAGGSSGGSAAAVAAGFCTAALGTDTLGSVRIPASYCGVVGAKPPHGAIPLDGVVPLAPAFDTIGVLAATTDIALQVLAAMGANPGPPAPISTLGILETPHAEITPAIAAALQTAADAAHRRGCQVTSITTLPGLDLRALRQAALLITALAANAEHAPAIAEHPEGFCPRFRNILAWAHAREPDHARAARHLLQQTATHLRDHFARYDAVLMPTTPAPAFPVSNAPPKDQPDFTLLANITGLPAIAYPAGTTPQGLPLSLQTTSSSLAACAAAAP